MYFIGIIGINSRYEAEVQILTYMCCLKQSDTRLITVFVNFIDIASTGLNPVAGFLLGINYGLFVASNGKK